MTLRTANVTFEPVRTRRTFEEVVQQIGDAIRSGDLRIGDRLPPERELVEIMEISRPTLRAALRVLTEAGVVGHKAGARKGAYVVGDVIPRDITSRGWALERGEVWDILQARRLVEPRVAQLAGFYATDRDFEAMEATIEEQRTGIGNRRRFVQLDHRFHFLIARATRNGAVVEIMRSMLDRLEIVYDLVYRRPLEPERGIALHEETLRALMKRDAHLIDVAMDRHLAFLEEIWQEETGQAAPRELPAFVHPHHAEEGAP